MTDDRPDDAAPIRSWTRPRALAVLAAAVTIVALVLLVVGARADHEVVLGGAEETETAAPTVLVSTPPSPSHPSPVAVVVHVLGSVATPGLVEVPSGARVQAAITAAGGATDQADLGRVNLARPVVDGEQLYVPAVGEEDPPIAAGPVVGSGPVAGGADAPGAAGAPGSRIDLNSADATTLQTLPGIGPALAGRIIAWRDEHGRFGSVEDLLDVAGIGDARFAELQDRVRV